VASIIDLGNNLLTINADGRDEEEEKARLVALPQTFAAWWLISTWEFTNSPSCTASIWWTLSPS